jgi:uncharacterized protein YgiB involved in biofilm formation
MTDSGVLLHTNAIDALVHAARVNVERGHFMEAYEGFNDCPAARDESKHCDCGWAEAKVALTMWETEI